MPAEVSSCRWSKIWIGLVRAKWILVFRSEKLQPTIVSVDTIISVISKISSFTDVRQ